MHLGPGRSTLKVGAVMEALALVPLKSRSIVEPKLVWASLLELASTLAGRRGSKSISRALHERVAISARGREEGSGG